MTERIASTSESCLVLIARSSPRAGRLTRVWARAARAIVSPAVLILLLTAGCTPNDQEVNSFIHAWEASVSAPDYRVQPPDSVTISSSTAPEIDGASSVIRQDGKITLCLVGDVKVAGMTPVEISRKIESLLEQYYVDPQVSVQASGQASKKFFVFGEVGGGGALPYTGRDTLLSVLAQAQPSFVAWRSRIKVIHPSHEEDKRRIMTVDADRIMQEGRLDQNILIEEGDIIYVPPTPLGWVALRLREIVWPFAPIAQTALSPYHTYDDTESETDRFDD